MSLSQKYRRETRWLFIWFPILAVENNNNNKKKPKNEDKKPSLFSSLLSSLNCLSVYNSRAPGVTQRETKEKQESESQRERVSFFISLLYIYIQLSITKITPRSIKSNPSCH